MNNKTLEERDIEIEAKLLEQEHRPTHLVLNYLRRKVKWPDKNDPRRKAVSKAIVYRLFFSPAVLAFTGSSIIGIATIVFMGRQNSLLFEQNQKLIEQNNLIEADRRSAQVFVMSDVMQDLQKEISEKPKDSIISNILSSRIVALSRAMKPYRPLKGDTLSDLTSPERGQLLGIMLNSGINSKQLAHKIFSKKYSDFSYSELPNYSGSIGNPKGDIEFIPHRIEFGDINLSYSNLNNTEFTSSKFYLADFTGCNLNNSSLRVANIMTTKFNNSSLINCDFKLSKLYYCDFNNANLSGADFTNAHLMNAKLKGSNLTNTNLHLTIVERKDWIAYVKDSLKLKGSFKIDSLYKVEAYLDKFRIIPKKW